jgi:hypothetical protein
MKIEEGLFRKKGTNGTQKGQEGIMGDEYD